MLALPFDNTEYSVGEVEHHCSSMTRPPPALSIIAIDKKDTGSLAMQGIVQMRCTSVAIAPLGRRNLYWVGFIGFEMNQTGRRVLLVCVRVVRAGQAQRWPTGSAQCHPNGAFLMIYMIDLLPFLPLG